MIQTLRAEGHDLAAMFGDIQEGRQTITRQGSVAVIRLAGVLSMRGGFLAASTRRFASDIERLVDDRSVKAVVAEFDTPGGQFAGTVEAADRIFRLRGRKPMIAVASPQAISASYWLATAFDEVWVQPSGVVGGIGIAVAHVDRSGADRKAGVKFTHLTAGKYKVEGNPHSPLDDEAREELRRHVDRAYSMMTNDIARFRGVSPVVVRSAWGQGRLVGAEDAVRLGMADRVGTLNQAVMEARFLRDGKTVSTRLGRLQTEAASRRNLN